MEARRPRPGTTIHRAMVDRSIAIWLWLWIDVDQYGSMVGINHQYQLKYHQYAWDHNGYMVKNMVEIKTSMNLGNGLYQYG